MKSRIQGAEKGVGGGIPKYNWTYPAYGVDFCENIKLFLIWCLFLLCFPRLMTILREEGPAALYKGFVPKVLRLAPGGGVLLLVVEFTLGVFRKGTPRKLLSLQFALLLGSLVLIVASFRQLLALLTCRRHFFLKLHMLFTARRITHCFRSR